MCETVMDRSMWLIIGFMVGYLIGAVQNVSDPRDYNEVRARLRRKKDERGLVRKPLLLDFVLAVVVIMTAIAAWQSITSNRQAADAVDANSRNSMCTQVMLSKVISAANERSASATTALRANLDLQESQAKMIATILQPDSPAGVGRKAFEEYFDALQDFIKAQTEQLAGQQQNPWPTIEEYTDCLGFEVDEETQ